MDSTSTARVTGTPRRDGGFTLIELLVVMIIIGVLAAIAIPTFLEQKQKARDAAVKSDMHNLSIEMLTAQVDGQAYPVPRALHAAGVTVKASPTVIESVVWTTATDYCIVATSTSSGKETSGYGAYAGITTRVFAESSSSGPAEVTAANPGCVTSPSSSTTNGWFGSDGYHDGAIGH